MCQEHITNFSGNAKYTSLHFQAPFLHNPTPVPVQIFEAKEKRKRERKTSTIYAEELIYKQVLESIKIKFWTPIFWHWNSSN